MINVLAQSMKRTQRVSISFVAAVIIFSSPTLVFAVGSSAFENASYSARTLAQANAVIARPQDPSTISFNPAGLLELPGVQTNLGLELLDFRVFHRNQVTGDHNQNEMKIIEIPTFYLTANPGELLDNRVALGIGINSPFGLSSKFPSIGVGRYTGWENYMKMMATTISGALKLSDKLSVGAGATNYWVFKYGQILNYPNQNILNGGGVAGRYNDGKALIETDGFGWGWNFGILAKPAPKHRLGFSFRSKADVNAKGKVVINGLELGGVQGYDVFPDFESGAHTQLHLPQNFTWGYAYVPSEKWAAEFDFGITGWKIFEDQNYDFDRNNATLRGLGTIPRDYQDAWSFNLGGHRQISKKMDFLAGFFFYQAAAPKKHVDDFLPDAHRYGWTLGTSYKLSDRASLDLMYMFILFGSRIISNPQVPAKGGENIDGRYTSFIQGTFISFNYKFDFPFEKRVKVNSAPPTVEAKAPPAKV